MTNLKGNIPFFEELQPELRNEGRISFLCHFNKVSPLLETRWPKPWALEEMNAPTSFWCRDLTEDGNYSSIKEIQEGKEVQYHAISPEDLLLPQTQQEPSVWMLGLTISYMYTRNCTANNPDDIGRPIVTKRDNSGKVKSPDMKLIPPGVPVSCSDIAGYLLWRKVFAKFLHINCMAAWHIWMTV